MLNWLTGRYIYLFIILRGVMEQIKDIQKLVYIAKMYYIEGMTQESIAKEVGISRSAVSQLITEAKNAGLVQITIRTPP